MMARASASVGAVVLAAGRSVRMGEAKQLLRVSGRTVLERTLENVRGARVDEIVLVLGSSAEVVSRRLPPAHLDGLKVVINQNFEEGMASSLREGLRAMSPLMCGALIVLADQPFVRSETLNRIIERYRESGAEIVIPFYGGKRGNPVLLDRSVFTEVMALEGDTGCRAIFPNHVNGIVEMPVDDEGIVLDIDDREDYERLRGYEG
jgi:molybdenum cofactor cytidylyltransferase